MRIIGLDPGLRYTGFGIIESKNGTLTYIGSGVITPNPTESLAKRLAFLCVELLAVIKAYVPNEASVEEVFVNMNPQTTLKLGMARGVVLAMPALEKIDVFEYSANKIKKSITGFGHAEKNQIQCGIQFLLPKAPRNLNANAADALASAICHAHSNLFRPISMRL